MSFSGRHEHSRDGLDCVAIFDGVSWRLELVQSQVKGLKATRCGSPPAYRLLITKPRHYDHMCVNMETDNRDALFRSCSIGSCTYLNGSGAVPLGIEACRDARG